MKTTIWGEEQDVRCEFLPESEKKNPMGLKGKKLIEGKNTRKKKGD